MRHQVRQLLRQICLMEGVVVVYHCDCGQRLLLTNFEPVARTRETDMIDVVVLKTSRRVACPQCGISLVPVWQAAERVLAEDRLARLKSLGTKDLLQVLQMELRGLQEARLKCN